MPDQTLDQQRAAAALAATDAVVSPTVRAKYVPLVQGAAVFVRTNGLGPALAFWLSKAEAEHAALANALATWLLRPAAPPEGAAAALPARPGKDLMQHLATESMAEYQRATAEAYAYLNWLKRFAAAL